ncbi:hypothetical protein PMIN01_07535 [Paraphaeosphaeria minitans]|uniref:Uncharacterized protein n=1 Tax=Paraphaeosphaeria minitans TaxID=565426 RepID=A0A9P6KQ06_9PLEO|nr:hypothetical protein PMIN01_07535 [Paraphaeosphaeria minitans]
MFPVVLQTDINAEERRTLQYAEEPNSENPVAWNKTLEAAQIYSPECRKAGILSGNVCTTLSNLLFAAKVEHTHDAAAEYSAAFGPGEFSETPSNHPMVKGMPLWVMTNAVLSVRDVDRPAVSAPTLSYDFFTSFVPFKATDPRAS